MLDHLIDPDIPTEKQLIEYSIDQLRERMSYTENKIACLEDDIDCWSIELSELLEKLDALNGE